MFDIRQAENTVHLGLQVLLVERPEALGKTGAITGFDNLHPLFNLGQILAVVRVDLDAGCQQCKGRAEQKDPCHQPER